MDTISHLAAQLPVQEEQIINSILTEDISSLGVGKIIEALRMKKYIITAVLPETPESESFAHFLNRFLGLQ